MVSMWKSILGWIEKQVMLQCSGVMEVSEVRG